MDPRSNIARIVHDQPIEPNSSKMTDMSEDESESDPEKTRFKWLCGKVISCLKPDFRFSITTAMLLITLVSCVLSILKWSDPSFRPMICWCLTPALLLVLKCGKWSIITFFVGGAIGAWYGDRYKINWDRNTLQYLPCLLCYVSMGAALSTALHGLIRLRLILAILAVVAVYFSFAELGASYGEYQWNFFDSDSWKSN